MLVSIWNSRNAAQGQAQLSLELVYFVPTQIRREG